MATITGGSAAATPVSQPAAGPRSLRRRETRAALVFLAPAAFGFLVFFAWPTLRGFYLSLTDYDVLTAPKFSGLDNYRTLIHDEVFWNSLWVTLE